MQKVPQTSNLEFSFVAFTLFLSTGAVWSLLRIENIDVEKGDPLMRVTWVCVYAAMAWVTWSNRSQFFEALKSSKILLLLNSTVLISMCWSQVPGITLRHGIALFGTTVIGVYLGTRFTLRGQLKLLVWVLGLCALFSLLFVILLPGYGISPAPDEGAWRGAFVHKNSLGRMMLLSAVAFLFYPGLQRHRSLRWTGIALSGLLILYSQSMTSTVLFIIVLALSPVLEAIRSRARWIWWAVGLVSAFFALWASWIATHLDVVVDFLNRDLTLTGRVPLWIGSYEAITQRPWLGYGYGGFWLGPNSPAYWVWQTAGWEAPHAHNGFLELWLNLGTLGGGLFLLSYGLALVGAIRWLRISRTTAGLWPIVYLIFMLLSNLTESAILAQNSVFWILYVAVVIKCDAILATQHDPRTILGAPVLQGC